MEPPHGKSFTLLHATPGSPRSPAGSPSPKSKTETLVALLNISRARAVALLDTGWGSGRNLRGQAGESSVEAAIERHYASLEGAAGVVSLDGGLLLQPDQVPPDASSPPPANGLPKGEKSQVPRVGKVSSPPAPAARPAPLQEPIEDPIPASQAFPHIKKQFGGNHCSSSSSSMVDSSEPSKRRPDAVVPSSPRDTSLLARAARSPVSPKVEANDPMANLLLAGEPSSSSSSRRRKSPAAHGGKQPPPSQGGGSPASSKKGHSGPGSPRSPPRSPRPPEGQSALVSEALEGLFKSERARNRLGRLYSGDSSPKEGHSSPASSPKDVVGQNKNSPSSNKSSARKKGGQNSPSPSPRAGAVDRKIYESKSPPMSLHDFWHKSRASSPPRARSSSRHKAEKAKKRTAALPGGGASAVNADSASSSAPDAAEHDAPFVLRLQTQAQTPRGKSSFVLRTSAARSLCSSGGSTALGGAAEKNFGDSAVREHWLKNALDKFEALLLQRRQSADPKMQQMFQEHLAQEDVVMKDPVREENEPVLDAVTEANLLALQSEDRLWVKVRGPSCRTHFLTIAPSRSTQHHDSSLLPPRHCHSPTES